MKIGIILTAYNCADYIDNCLKPWFNLKQKHDIIVAANSGMFKEYLTLGFIDKNQKTLETLIKYRPNFLVSTYGNNLLDENSSRNLCLEFLKQNNCDVIWIVDGDEIYTEEQIERIIEHITNNAEFDVYHIELKNYTFVKNLWTDKYSPPRIFWVNRFGGINKFYFDNHIVYNDGSTSDNKSICIIPKKIAFVDHYCWLEADSRSVEKIQYQNIRFAGEEGNRCSFVFDGKLKFNMEFYQKRNMQLPALHETLSIHSLDFELAFDRPTNSVHVTNCLIEGDYTFLMYYGKSKLMYESIVPLIIGKTYVISCEPENDFDFILIKVIKDGKICHEEKLHLNY